MTISRFQKTILAWYKKNRRDMPWRKTKDPYKILVSEVMLQQTQVSRVIPKYKEFLQKFPTLEKLAKASDKDLLKTWAGLGYWRRAKYLKKIAKTIYFLQGVGPHRSGVKHKENIWFERFSDPKTLEKLPGIGHYTARAIACFAFGNREAFLDTNIRRVYLHFFFRNKNKVSDKEILKVAQKAVWKKNPREWHYALFDYGATVLKDKGINKRSKQYAKQSKFKGSFRSFRTKVMQFLLSQSKYQATHKKVKTLLAKTPYPPTQILASLLKDNLIKDSRGYYTL